MKRMVVLISLKPPCFQSSATLSTFSDSASALLNLIPNLKSAYICYLRNEGKPSIVVPLGGILPFQVTQLTGIYESTYKKLVGDKYKLNWIFDLRNGDDLPYCPMCGNAGRDALDHYLPKADYPEFSFFKFNLVPTCTACNSRRGKYANKPGTVLGLLHPYFDGPELNSPLTMVEIQGDNFSGGTTYEFPSFKLVPIISTTHHLFFRLENHLNLCVKPSALTRWIKGRWSFWRVKACMFPDLLSLQVSVSSELNSEIIVGGPNNWTVAFLRGLLLNKNALEWLRLNPYP